MNVFEWAGKEKQLVPGSTVEAFSVTELVIHDGEALARGTISLVDYTTQIEKDRRVTIPWRAVSIIVGDTFGPDWLVSKDGKNVRFCAGFVHDALCMFIRTELSANVRTHPKKCDEVPAAAAEMSIESAPLCICNEIEASQSHRPFDWHNGHSGGFSRVVGNYRCIVCSCGECWWLRHPEKELWARVLSEEMWDALIDCRGVPFRAVAYLPGGVCLLSELDSRKFAKKFSV